MKKKALAFFFLLLILFVVIVALLPSFFSTQAGTKLLLSFIEKKIDAKIAVSDLSLSWKGPQKAEIIIIDGKDYSLHLNEVSTSSSLFPLFLSGFTFIEKNNDQYTFFPLDISGGTLEIPEAKLVVQGINSSLIPRENHSFQFDLSAFSEAAGKAGEISLKARGKNIYNITLDGIGRSFPLRAIDAILSLNNPSWEDQLTTILGSTIDFSVIADRTKDHLSMQFSVDTPHLTTSADFQTRDDLIFLTHPSSIFLDITPELVNRMKQICPESFSSFSLTSRAEARLDLSQLSLPLHANQFQHLATVGHLRVTNGSLVIVNSPPLDLNWIDLNFSSPDLAKSLDVNGQTSTMFQNRENRLNFQGSIENFYDFRAKISSTDFPLSLLSPSPLSQLIGPYLNAELQIDRKNQAGSLTFSGQTEQLSIPNTSFSYNGAWNLQDPVTIRFSPNPLFWNSAINREDFRFEAIPAFPLKISHLSFGSEDLSLDLEAQIPSISWQDLLILDQTTTTPLNAKVTITSYDQINTVLQGEHLTVNGNFRYDPNTLIFSSSSPVSFSYVLTDRVFHELIAPFGEGAELVSPTSLNGKVDQFSVSLVDENNYLINGSIETNHLTARNRYTDKIASFSKPTLSFFCDTTQEQFSLDFATEALEQEKKSGKIDLLLDLDENKEQWQAELNRLSTSFLTTFFGFEEPVEEIIGKELNFSLIRKITPSNDLLQTALSSKNLTCKANLEKKGDLLTLQNKRSPLSLRFDLTPNGFKAMKEILPAISSLSTYDLLSTTTLAFQCDRLSLPLTDWKNAQMPLIDVHGEGTLENFSIVEKERNNSAELSRCNFSIEKERASPRLHAEILGTTSSKKRGQHTLLPGDLSAALTLTITPQKPPAIQLRSEANKFPSLLIDFASRLGGNIPLPVSLLFGEEIDLNFSTSLENNSGPVDFTLSTPTARSTLRGLVSNGVLTLRDPLFAQFEMTKELGSFLLRDITDNVTSIQTTSPLYLQIPAKGFALPLFPFSLDKAYIPSMRLDLGKLLLHNSGNLLTALSILKQGQFSRGQMISLWFTPIDMQVSQGKLYVDRTDVLIDELYRIAFWGNVNLLSRKVEMQLALPGETLETTLAIPDLPRDYHLLIPIRGTTGNVEIDTKTATAKIAALLLWKNRGRGGETRRGLGGLVDAFATLPDAKAKVPPAKRPFPWE